MAGKRTGGLGPGQPKAERKNKKMLCKRLAGCIAFFVFCIIGKSYELPYDTKMLRKDAHANAEEIVA